MVNSLTWLLCKAVLSSSEFLKICMHRYQFRCPDINSSALLTVFRNYSCDIYVYTITSLNSYTCCLTWNKLYIAMCLYMEFTSMTLPSICTQWHQWNLTLAVLGFTALLTELKCSILINTCWAVTWKNYCTCVRRDSHKTNKVWNNEVCTKSQNQHMHNNRISDNEP